jgi:hypothetical protein
MSRCSCTIFEKQKRALAVLCVAIVIAVDQIRPEFSQVACFDRLIALDTADLRTGQPAIHQYKFHVAPPNAKQNTASDGRETLGGGAQR